jgi:hypothetical protein
MCYANAGHMSSLGTARTASSPTGSAHAQDVGPGPDARAVLYVSATDFTNESAALSLGEGIAYCADPENF